MRAWIAAKMMAPNMPMAVRNATSTSVVNWLILKSWNGTTGFRFLGTLGIARSHGFANRRVGPTPVGRGRVRTNGPVPVGTISVSATRRWPSRSRRSSRWASCSCSPAIYLVPITARPPPVTDGLADWSDAKPLDLAVGCKWGTRTTSALAARTPSTEERERQPTPPPPGSRCRTVLSTSSTRPVLRRASLDDGLQLSQPVLLDHVRAPFFKFISFFTPASLSHRSGPTIRR